MSKEILDKFSANATHRYGIDLYCIDDAITLVKMCQGEAVPVLGLDAFILEGNKTQPSMDNSIDLSYEADCYSIAIDFLEKRRNSNFLYEVVY